MKINGLIYGLLSTLGMGLCGSLLALELNTADRSSLEAVKGLGPKKAAIILAEREKNGPFKNAQDFADRVKGIGSKSVAKMQAAGLTINGDGTGIVRETTKMTKKSNKMNTIATDGLTTQTMSTAATTAAKTKVLPGKQTIGKAQEVVQNMNQATADVKAAEMSPEVAVTNAVKEKVTATSIEKSNALIDKALNKAADKAIDKTADKLLKSF